MFPVLAGIALCMRLASSASGALDDPLPEAGVLLQGLAERQRSYEQELNDYTYDVEVVEEQLDANNQVKSQKARRYEVFFVKGRRVRRLVAEDGVPLSAERQAKVDAKVRAYVGEVLEGKQDKRRRVQLSEIIERYDFRSVARDVVLGRSTVVLEFAPRPGKTKLEHDNVLRRLAGRIWIDEGERVVVRSFVHNTGGIKIALGLGASIRDVAVTTDFVKVDDRVWLPARVESRVAGRVMLFKGLHERTTSSFGRYRRFEVESEEKPRLPR